MVYPDLSNSRALAVAGLARAQYAKVNSSGLPLGPTGTISQGSDRGMGLYVAVKQTGGTSPQPSIVNVTGDNRRFRRKFTFNAEDIGEMDMNFGIINMDAYAAFTTTKVYTDQDWDFIPIMPNSPAGGSQFVLIFNHDAQDADVAGGQQRWYNEIFFLVTVTPTTANKAEAAAVEWPYKGSPTNGAVLPWGEAITTANWGCTEMAGTGVSTRYPLSMHTYVSNASTTRFTLDYTPSSDHTGRTVKVWKTTSAGVNTKLTATTDYTVIPGDKEIRLTSAGSAGDTFVVLYEAIDIL